MIVLYHCVSARSFRPLWTLEELGQPYELKMLPFPPRVLAPQFLEINPSGTVPLLIDGQTRMTESAAMCDYLVRRSSANSDLQVSVGEADFGAYLNWMHMSDATLTFPQTLILRYRHFETPERQLPQVADDYARWFLARLRAVDKQVQEREYLCAGRFTAADIAVGYALMLGEHLGLDDRYPAGVQNYWARLQKRPAYIRALQVQHDAAKAQGVDTCPAPDLRLS